MYRDLVERIADARRTMYKSDIQPPAPEEVLQRLRQRTRDELGADLPEGYLDFLRLTDGLNWNGLFVYASGKNPVIKKPTVFMHPFIEDNLDWRSYEPHKNYLFFADGEISLYVYNLVGERYEILDRPSETIMGTFGTFEEMITAALKEHLRDDEENEDDE